MNFDDLDLATLRARRGEKWQQFPDDDVLSAWVADMDFPVAQPIHRVLTRMLEVTDLGYPINPNPRGLPSLFAERVAGRFDWQIEPRQVEVLTDVVQGMYTALLVYSQEGERTLIQTPIYPPFLVAARETGRPAVLNTLERGPERYEIDFDALEASLTPDTRTIMLCNPHNPTGRVFTRAELERIAEIVVARDLIVLSDEIHAELVFADAKHIPIATLGPEIEARTVTFMSASKSFNIAGLRCAVAVFGNQELRRKFLSIPRHVRGGIGTLGLAATRTAWEECDDWLDAVVEYLCANRDFLTDFVKRELPDVRYAPPEATYLAWLDCRALDLGGDPCRYFLDQAKVALSDGRSFGEGGEGFVRLNFATSRKILTEILERIARSL